MNYFWGPAYGGFGAFGLFRVLFVIVFLLVIGTFIAAFVKGIREWNQNNHSPRLTVSASVAAKRTDVTRHTRADAGGCHHTGTSTSYYVTFQVDSGDRMEFCVSGQEYGMLVDGDTGNLSFQGSRYLGFVRT